MAPRNRREFFTDVGRGMLIASVGGQAAANMGLAPAVAAQEGSETLTFGPMEPLVCLMQETPVERLLPVLVQKLQTGTELKQLVAAAALANARTFGGEDYIGFHTMMALSPAYHMARELPMERQALPVLKVLYRNTSRIQATGGRKSEVLHPVHADTAPAGPHNSEALREAVHQKDAARAEAILAAAIHSSPTDAFNDLMLVVEEQPEVHRVVLPYRAWDMLDIVGQEHAHTMLRQSVRYCLKVEPYRTPAWSEPETVLTKALDSHGLLGRQPGNRAADDAWVEQMSQTIFRGTGAQAADAVAAALAEGFAPDTVGEAISLAANQLVLRDMGRIPAWEDTGKPVGSVHGDSVGVHACDSANAWRNMARVGNARNSYACAILGAYQVAHDRAARGDDFLKWEPLPVAYHLAQVTAKEPDVLLRQAEEAIRGNLQAHASAIVHHYGQLGHPARPMFDLMLRYAVSEDGSLHAEKYYRTASAEFAATRPAFRWRQVVALARVTASEYGRPAPGYADACRLLKV
jgi:hypothetical protein